MLRIAFSTLLIATPLAAQPVLAPSQSTFADADARALALESPLAALPLLPNLVIAPDMGGRASDGLRLRGLSLSSNVEGISLPGLTAADFALFDASRLVVRRGPQPEGSSGDAHGGALMLDMHGLENTVAGFVEGGIGGTGDRLLRASVSIPLDARLALGVTGYWQDGNGRARNSTTGERSNDPDRAGIRFAAKLSAADWLTWNLSLSHVQSGDTQLPTFRCDPADPGRCDGRFITTGMRTGRVLGGNAQYDLPISGGKARQPLGSEYETTLLMSLIEVDLGGHALSLRTGWADHVRRVALDSADGRAAPDLATPFPPVRGFANGGSAMIEHRQAQQFTQSANLSGLLTPNLSYVAGLFLRDASLRSDRADLQTLDDGSAAGQPALLADRIIRTSRRTLAAHGTLTYAATPALTAKAGVRYTDEVQKLRVSDNRSGCAPHCFQTSLIAPDGTPIPLRLNDHGWTPYAAVEFAATDAIGLFASAARGFAMGDWNTGATNPAAMQAQRGTTSWTFEGGVRARLHDRLAVKLQGFLIRADDQAVSVRHLGVTAGHNAVDFRNHGVELELKAQPVDGLALFVNAGHQRARYRLNDGEGGALLRAQQAACLAQLAAGRLAFAPGAANAPDCGAGIVTADGRIAAPAYTPRWSLAAGGSYDWPLPSAGIILSPAVSASWRSAMETSSNNVTLYADGGVWPANTSGGALIGGSHAPARWLVHAALAIRTDDDSWQLSVSCDNCFDTAKNEQGVGFHQILSPQRSWMVRARRDF